MDRDTEKLRLALERIVAITAPRVAPGQRYGATLGSPRDTVDLVRKIATEALLRTAEASRPAAPGGARPLPPSQ